jgi:hypothetical protein
MRGRESEFLSD